jgi:hypothetical protein
MSAFLKAIAIWAGNASHDYWNALLHPHYAYFYLIGLLPFLLAAAAVWGKRQMTIRHSTLLPHQNMFGVGGIKNRFSLLIAVGYLCLTASVTNIDLALMQPQVPQAKVEHLVQTHDICGGVDDSGSMTTPLMDGVVEVADAAAAAATNDPAAVTVDNRGSDKVVVQAPKKEEKPHPQTRVDAAQMAFRFLVSQLMTYDPLNTNRVCMFRFDMDSYILSPLTNDKIVAMLRTAHINENSGGGTNFAGLSDSGIGILQKLYDYLIANTAENAARVEFLITDGYDSIDPQRRKDLVALYKQAHIHFYVIGLGDGWKEGSEKLDLEKFADELHAADPLSGIVFRARNPGAMKAAIEKVTSLEKSQEIVETVETYRDVDYAFIAVAGFLIIFFFGFATLARRIP